MVYIRINSFEILDAPEVYVIKKTSVFNNFDSNTRIDDVRLVYNKIDLTDEDVEDMKKKNTTNRDPYISKALHLAALDHVNFFQTKKELDNIMSIAKELGISKFLVYSSSKDQAGFNKILTKLVRAKKELRRDDFCILVTNNPGLVAKEVRIMK